MTYRHHTSIQKVKPFKVVTRSALIQFTVKTASWTWTQTERNRTKFRQLWNSTPITYKQLQPRSFFPYHGMIIAAYMWRCHRQARIFTRGMGGGHKQEREDLGPPCPLFLVLKVSRGLGLRICEGALTDSSRENKRMLEWVHGQSGRSRSPY